MRAVNVNVINGRGLARGAGSVIGAAFAISLFLHLALYVAIIALVVVSVRLVIALCTTPDRPAVVAYDAHNDAAALAHRARMAAIRNAR